MPVPVISKPAVAMHSTHAEVSAFHFFKVEEMAAHVESLAPWTGLMEMVQKRKKQMGSRRGKPLGVGMGVALVWVVVGSPWCLGNMVNKCKVLVLVLGVGRWVLGLGVGVGVGGVLCFVVLVFFSFFRFVHARSFYSFYPKSDDLFLHFSSVFRAFVVRVIP